MIAVMRENAGKTGMIPELPLPPGTQIGVAVSGGADSSALLVLLAKYGRRIVAHPQAQLTVLHYNHRWRGEASDQDAEHVRALARHLGLRCVIERAPEPATEAETGPVSESASVPGLAGTNGPGPTRSLRTHSFNEDVARTERKAFFSRFLQENPGAWIFTAHHANDLAETVLWRLLTGAPSHQEGGILPCSRAARELRPLLTTPKTELISFLTEEGRPWTDWREDLTNQDGRLLRSALRVKVVPELDRLFPRWVQTLGERAAGVWNSEGSLEGNQEGSSDPSGPPSEREGAV